MDANAISSPAAASAMSAEASLHRAARHDRHITWMHGEGQAIQCRGEIDDTDAHENPPDDLRRCRETIRLADSAPISRGFTLYERCDSPIERGRGST